MAIEELLDWRKYFKCPGQTYLTISNLGVGLQNFLHCLCISFPLIRETQ